MKTNLRRLPAILDSRVDTHFSVVQEVGCGLQAAEGDHAGSGADHEVV